MPRYKISDSAIKYITVFESFTRCRVKDCLITDERIIFIIEEAEAGKAIGRHGSNVKSLERAIKKRIKIIEFNKDVSQFIKNVIYPNQLKDVRIEDKTKTIYLAGNDRHTNSIIIGRDSKNLDFLTSLVKRYFDIQNIKVTT